MALSRKIRDYNREYQRNRRSLVKKGEFAENRPANGIDSIIQVDSVLREMGEIESAVRIEKKKYQEKISSLNQYLLEAIEPWQSRQDVLRSMLIKFMEKHFEKQNCKSQKFEFGVVKKTKNGFQVKLNVDLASQRRGKP